MTEYEQEIWMRIFTAAISGHTTMDMTNESIVRHSSEIADQGLTVALQTFSVE